MADKPENPPAFPSKTILRYDIGDGVSEEHGMTLRDYFAGQWLSTFRIPPGEGITSEEIAKRSYKAADAMLKERNNK